MSLAAKRLDRIFFALSDRTRRRIISRLASGEATMSSFVESLGKNKQLISKHLKVLEEAGLVKKETKGRLRPCHLDPKILEIATRELTRYQTFWNERFEFMDQYLESLNKVGKK